MGMSAVDVETLLYRAKGKVSDEAYEVLGMIWRWGEKGAYGEVLGITIQSVAFRAGIRPGEAHWALRELEQKGYIRHVFHDRHRRNKRWEVVELGDLPGGS